MLRDARSGEGEGSGEEFMLDEAPSDDEKFDGCALVGVLFEAVVAEVVAFKFSELD